MATLKDRATKFVGMKGFKNWLKLRLCLLLIRQLNMDKTSFAGCHSEGVLRPKNLSLGGKQILRFAQSAIALAAAGSE